MTIQLTRSFSSHASSMRAIPHNDKYDVAEAMSDFATNGNTKENTVETQPRRVRSSNSYNDNLSMSVDWEASRNNPLLDSYVQNQPQAWYSGMDVGDTQQPPPCIPQTPSRLGSNSFGYPKDKDEVVEEEPRSGGRRGRLQLLNCFREHQYDDSYFASTAASSVDGGERHRHHLSKRKPCPHDEKSTTSLQRRFDESFDHLDSTTSVSNFEDIWKEGLQQISHTTTTDTSLVEMSTTSSSENNSPCDDVNVTMTSHNILDDDLEGHNDRERANKTVSWKPKLTKLFRPRRRRAKSLDGAGTSRATVDDDHGQQVDDDFRAWQVADPPLFEASPSVVVSTNGDRDDYFNPLETTQAEAVECEYRPDFSLQEKLESGLSWVDVPDEDKEPSPDAIATQQKALNVIELGQYASSINSTKNEPIAKRGWFEKRKIKGIATIYDDSAASPSNLKAKRGWGKNLGGFFDKEQDTIPSVGRSQSSLSSTGSVLAVSYGKESCAQLVIQQQEDLDASSQQTSTGSRGILRHADSVSYGYSQTNNSILDKTQTSSIHNSIVPQHVIHEDDEAASRQNSQVSIVDAKSEKNDQPSDHGNDGESESEDEDPSLLLLEEFSVKTSELKTSDSEPIPSSVSGNGSRLGAAFAHPAASVRGLTKQHKHADKIQKSGPVDLDDLIDDKEVDDFISQLTAKKLHAPRLVRSSSATSSHASSNHPSKQQERKEVMGNVTYHHFQSSSSVTRKSTSAASQTPSRSPDSNARSPPSTYSTNSAKCSDAGIPPSSTTAKRDTPPVSSSVLCPAMTNDVAPGWRDAANRGRLVGDKQVLAEDNGTNKNREMKRDEQAKVWKQVPLQKSLWSDLSNLPPPVSVSRTKTEDHAESYLQCMGKVPFPKTRTSSSTWTRDFSESSWRGGPPRVDSGMTGSISNLTTSTFGDEDEDILDTFYRPIDKLAQRLEQKMCSQIHDDPRLAAVVSGRCRREQRGGPPTVPYDEMQIDFRLKRRPKRRSSQRENYNDFPDPE